MNNHIGGTGLDNGSQPIDTAMPSNITPKTVRFSPKIKVSKKRLRNAQVSPASELKKSTSMPITSTTSSSELYSKPVKIPASHIRRTPSELLLEELTLHAEWEDARMYSRLVCGMYDQLRRRSAVSGEEDGDINVMHPLSRKSLQGIVKTKHACDQELKLDDVNTTADYGCCWDLDAENKDSIPLLKSSTLLSSKPVQDTANHERCDDCVFSIEL